MLPANRKEVRTELPDVASRKNFDRLVRRSPFGLDVESRLQDDVALASIDGRKAPRTRLSTYVVLEDVAPDSGLAIKAGLA
ncbi:MAG: hypothetical protein FJ314_11050 [SAR202 cluster bacterium]|nr:hypothetical protein [SAR202 cluster bacterium]